MAIEQSMRKSHMLGPTKTQLILPKLISRIPLFRNHEDPSFLLVQKTKEIEHYLKIGVELKLFERKTGFLRFIWKLESRKLFEDWSLEN